VHVDYPQGKPVSRAKQQRREGKKERGLVCGINTGASKKKYSQKGKKTWGNASRGGVRK